jgi:hypothetical protein
MSDVKCVPSEHMAAWEGPPRSPMEPGKPKIKALADSVPGENLLPDS